MKRIWVDADRCLGCKTCELACAVERNSTTKTLTGALREEVTPQARLAVCGETGHSWPLQCRHCDDAPCVAVCPSGAAQRRAESGITFIDQSQCRGCWMCVMACPFGAVRPLASFKVAVKCDACTEMVEPACVASCPTGALLFGDEHVYDAVLAARRAKISALIRLVDPSKATSPDFLRG